MLIQYICCIYYSRLFMDIDVFNVFVEEEECKIALDLVDKDKNGTICFEEFSQYIL